MAHLYYGKMNESEQVNSLHYIGPESFFIDPKENKIKKGDYVLFQKSPRKTAIKSLTMAKMELVVCGRQQVTVYQIELMVQNPEIQTIKWTLEK